MQLKITAHLIVFLCFMPSLWAKALLPKECYECEEEIWEEVQCDKIPSNFTSVTPKPTTPVQRPTTYPPTKPTHSPYISAPPMTTLNPEVAALADPYKKCYLECKLGCKEFCRKVVMNPYDKQIVQVSKISEPADKGRIQSTHILQRELIPTNAAKNYDNFIPSDKEESEDYVKYYSKPIVASVEPIYGVQSFNSYRPYHSRSTGSDDYNFPIPFENVFSKVVKASLDPAQSVQIALDDPGRKIANPSISSYSSPTPVNDAPLEANQHLDNIDESIDSFIREFISNNPTNQIHSKPVYTVSSNR